MTTGPEQASPQGEPNKPPTPPQTTTPPIGAPSNAGSVSPGKPGRSGPVPPLTHKTPWTAYIKPVLWTLVAIYVIVFVFLNRDTVEINFVFFGASVPLIFVLGGMALIGAGLTVGVMVLTSRRATKKAELAALKSSAPPAKAPGKTPGKAPGK
ncbi:MAG: LapA family protein [Actinobacteria bacterium]|nr:LapA family protein [Actinomycetota bacterium]